METNLLSEALKFMVLGMGVVFIFLTLMIFILKAQSKAILKYFPVKKEGNNSATLPIVNKSAKVAAIIAAIQHHRNIRG